MSDPSKWVEERLWEPPIYSWSFRSPGENLDLELTSEVEDGGAGPEGEGPEPFTCRIWLCLHVDNVRFELVVGYPAGVVGGKKKNSCKKAPGPRSFTDFFFFFNIYHTLKEWVISLLMQENNGLKEKSQLSLQNSLAYSYLWYFLPLRYLIDCDFWKKLFSELRYLGGLT